MVVPHRRRRFYRLLARQVHLQQLALSPIYTRAGRLHARPLACAAPTAAASHPSRHGYHLPVRRYRVQRLIILRSRPARVRHREYGAASPEHAAGAMSIPRRPRCFHRLPGHRAYLLRRRQRPLETLACRAPRTGRVPSPVRSTRCSCPPIAPYPPRFPRPSSDLYRPAR
ncbi:hypothetical protein B0H14DRAFT_72121 [Mycena olivaceomarginata]|nr:hypothetical protein B0H14DRAFT_72121 [Mycena olivaceomarginata]